MRTCVNVHTIRVNNTRVNSHHKHSSTIALDVICACDVIIAVGWHFVSGKLPQSCGIVILHVEMTN